LAPLLIFASEHFGFDYALKSADRAFLEQEIFAKLLMQGRYCRILFAGVEIYTCHYARLFRQKEFHTIDWESQKAIYGNRGLHQVGSVCHLDGYYDNDYFDTVLFNGLVGYGLNSRVDVDLALAQAHNVLNDDGLLIIGWNNTQSHLDFSLEDLPSYKLFQKHIPTVLGLESHRIAISSDNNHTFDFLSKKRLPANGD
jgi:hypothetical protein